MHRSIRFAQDDKALVLFSARLKGCPDTNPTCAGKADSRSTPSHTLSRSGQALDALSPLRGCERLGMTMWLV